MDLAALVFTVRYRYGMVARIPVPYDGKFTENFTICYVGKKAIYMFATTLLPLNNYEMVYCIH